MHRWWIFVFRCRWVVIWADYIDHIVINPYHQQGPTSWFLQHLDSPRVPDEASAHPTQSSHRQLIKEIARSSIRFPLPPHSIPTASFVDANDISWVNPSHPYPVRADDHQLASVLDQHPKRNHDQWWHFGTNNYGRPTPLTNVMTTTTYNLCKTAGGSGSQPIQWSTMRFDVQGVNQANNIASAAGATVVCQNGC